MLILAALSAERNQRDQVGIRRVSLPIRTILLTVFIPLQLLRAIGL